MLLKEVLVGRQRGVHHGTGEGTSVRSWIQEGLLEGVGENGLESFGGRRWRRIGTN